MLMVVEAASEPYTRQSRLRRNENGNRFRPVNLINRSKPIVNLDYTPLLRDKLMARRTLSRYVNYCCHLVCCEFKATTTLYRWAVS